MLRIPKIFAHAAAVVVVLSPGTTFAQESVDSDLISIHARVLSADSFLGRDTGSLGHEMAARYVASQCKEFGLVPLGDGYFHPVPMTRATITSATLTIGAESFTDIFPNFNKAGTLRSFSGPVVFEDQQSGRRIPNTLQTGAIVVTGGLIRSSAKIDSLSAEGAIGVIQLMPDSGFFELLRESRGRSRLFLQDETIPSAFAGAIPSLVAGPDITAALTSIIGSGGGEVFFEIETQTNPFTSPNVICVLENDGGGVEEFLALSAHLDHLGLGTVDQTGDSIFNGFSDNAAGVAMLLAIAERLRAQPVVSRPVVFLFFTGEERGLLGAEHFAASFSQAGNSIAGLINLDAGAPPAPPARWEVVAGNDSHLGEAAQMVAETNGWGVRVSAARPNSDFFPFHRMGIPSIFIIPGARPYDGKTEGESDALFERWDAYHQRSDEWNADFPFDGLQRYAEYAISTLIAYDRVLGGR